MTIQKFIDEARFNNDRFPSRYSESLESALKMLEVLSGAVKTFADVYMGDFKGTPIIATTEITAEMFVKAKEALEQCERIIND